MGRPFRLSSNSFCLIWINFSYIGAFSGAIFGLDVKTCYKWCILLMHGKFNKKSALFIFGMWDGRTVWNETLVDSLHELGINAEYYESQGTGHEWLYMATLLA